MIEDAYWRFSDLKVQSSGYKHFIHFVSNGLFGFIHFLKSMNIISNVVPVHEILIKHRSPHKFAFSLHSKYIVNYVNA